MHFSETLPEQLTHRLAEELPGQFAHRRVAPALAYGRHQGPPPSHARQAAVAVMIYRRQQTWCLPLTRRPPTIKFHGGQISFPGGRIEPGETNVEAAIREYVEELGIEPEDASVCGELTPLYVYASDNWVHPVVIACQAPQQAWKPDRIEVDTVIELPLPKLHAPDLWQTKLFARRVQGAKGTVGELQFRAPGLQVDSHHVWGATAMILAELADILLSTKT